MAIPTASLERFVAKRVIKLRTAGTELIRKQAVKPERLAKVTLRPRLERATEARKAESAGSVVAAVTMRLSANRGYTLWKLQLPRWLRLPSQCLVSRYHGQVCA